VLDLDGGSPCGDMVRGSPWGYRGSLAVHVSPHIILVVATEKVMIYDENLNHWFILDQSKNV
jgi:hypothetical protein